MKQKLYFLPYLCFLWLFAADPLFAQLPSFSPIVKSERSKVVHISTTSEKEIRVDPFFEHFIGPGSRKRKETALGSGFVISADGLIVTNNHVVEHADHIDVTFFNNKTYEAKVIGTDPRTDLALLKVEATKLPFVQFGNSDQLDVGDWVIAIGNPLGLDHSVTSGILSAKGRDIFRGTAYGKFLQTDAAINPGNSGGPLFNIQGKVIGINTAIVAGGQGLGFAIPSNLAMKVIDQLRQHGSVERGWLGIGIQPISQDLAESFGLPKGSSGIAITGVQPKSPAHQAGLRQGDVILQLNGSKTEKVTDLQQQIAESKPGTTVTLKIFRQGKRQNKTVKLGKFDAQKIVQQTRPKSRKDGLDLVALTPEIANQLGLSTQSGVLVRQISPQSSAYDAGLRKGDVIISVNRRPVNGPGAFYRQLAASPTARALTLVARRGGQVFIGIPKKS